MGKSNLHYYEFNDTNTISNNIYLGLCHTVDELAHSEGVGKRESVDGLV